MLFPFEVPAGGRSNAMSRRMVTWTIAHHCAEHGNWRAEKQIVRMQRRGWRHRRFRG